jgi:hypothetical protein
MMLLLTIFLCFSGPGAIGGIIGYFTKGKDRLRSVFLGALVSYPVTICIVAGLMIAGPLVGNVVTKVNSTIVGYSPKSLPADVRTQPTAIVWPPPTATPGPCFTWSQITTAMEGRTVCMAGTAAQVYTVYGNAQTRVNFTTAPNTFFLISTNLEFYYFQQDGTRRNLAAGDCVQATDVVKVFDDGRHRIPYMLITDLYRCGP